MRVLAIADGSSRGGAEEYFLELLSLVSARGLQIDVLVSDSADPTYVSDIEQLGLKLHVAPHVTVASYPDLAVEKCSDIVESSDLVWLADEAFPVASRVKRMRRDIPIIAHLHSLALLCPMRHKTFGLREPCTSPCSITRIIGCKQLGNQLESELGIIGNHRRYAYELLDLLKGPLDYVRWPINEEVIGSIDGFVSPSRYVKEAVLAHFPKNRAPIEIIENPIIVPDVHDELGNRSDEPTIFYASGPGLLKGPQIAVAAIRNLTERGKRISLNMARAQGYTWIENLVRKLNLTTHVKLMPRLTRKEFFARMAGSDLVIMPSIWPEAFGRIPVEANRLGTPAIVSNRGALPDTTIDGLTGIVAEPTGEAFAEAISTGLETNWNRERIIRIAGRFDPQNVANAFIRYLEKFV